MEAPAPAPEAAPAAEPAPAAPAEQAAAPATPVAPAAPAKQMVAIPEAAPIGDVKVGFGPGMVLMAVARVRHQRHQPPACRRQDELFPCDIQREHRYYK